MTSRHAQIAAAALCALFFALAMVWLDNLGIQTDEALFASAIYPPFHEPFSLEIFGRSTPVMVMTYVGALKSWLYRPILSVWGASAATTRVPMIVLGTLTVWLFYRLLLRTISVRAALAGCALLATDPMFLFTTRYDWGPVAIQHFCLAAGVFAVVCWWQDRRTWMLAAGFFLFGLGLWDKAIFMWLLVALGAATLVVFPGQLFTALKIRHAVVATAAILLGALPLLVYNLKNDFITFRSNTAWTTSELHQDARLLRYTLEGNALIGSIMRANWEQPYREPQTPAEKFCIKMTDAFGNVEKSWLFYAVIASLVLFPLAFGLTWRSVTFSTIFVAVGWLQMALIQGAGGGTHHTILLWPFPIVIVAAVISGLSFKIRGGAVAAALLTTLLCGVNLLAIGNHYRNEIRNGGTSGWTDAIYPLSSYLAEIDAPAVFLLDWGFVDNLRLLNRGRLPIRYTDDPVNDAAKKMAAGQVAEFGAVFVNHTKGNEFFPEQTARYLAYAAELGYAKRIIRTISDRNGREMIEVFRVDKQAPEQTAAAPVRP